jgi:hypothetical protein
VVVNDPSSQTFHIKDVPHGEVRQLRYTSKVTQAWRRTFVSTPPGYDNGLRTRYPAPYLQHGGGEDESGWLVQGRVDSIMDKGHAVKPGEAPAQADSSELALPVAITGNSPQQAIKGVVGVGTSVRPSGSPTYPLDVLAARSANRKKLAISVVNPTETAQDCDLNLTGVQPSRVASLWQLTAPAGAAAAPAGSGRGGFSGPPGDAGGKLTATGAAQNHHASCQHPRLRIRGEARTGASFSPVPQKLDLGYPAAFREGSLDIGFGGRLQPTPWMPSGTSGFGPRAVALRG